MQLNILNHIKNKRILWLHNNVSVLQATEPCTFKNSSSLTVCAVVRASAHYAKVLGLILS